ncbi:MAG: hypothetical protein ACK4OO_08240, partial [bacterium]
YDDGIQEAYWFSYEPRQGTVPAGEEQEVDLVLNPYRVAPGDYEALLFIDSNDPENQRVEVSINLTVVGAPDIAAFWNRDWGYPDVVDWNRRYADLFTENDYPMTITLANYGTEDLIVDGITFDNDYFTVDADQFELSPNATRNITVTLNAAEQGDYDATMTILTNDPDEEEFTIALHAQPLNPPIISIDPSSLEDELITGQTSQHELRVSNEGVAPLRFTIRHRIVAQPDADEMGRTLRSVDGSGPVRDAMGDIIAQFNQPQGGGANIYCSPVAWDWENEMMWITGYNNSFVAAWTHDNYQNFREVRRFQVASPMDGAWWNGILYIHSLAAGQQFQRYDAQGNNLGAINMGFNCYGVAVDHE